MEKKSRNLQANQMIDKALRKKKLKIEGSAWKEIEEIMKDSQRQRWKIQHWKNQDAPSNTKKSFQNG